MTLQQQNTSDSNVFYTHLRSGPQEQKEVNIFGMQMKRIMIKKNFLIYLRYRLKSVDLLT